MAILWLCCYWNVLHRSIYHAQAGERLLPVGTVGRFHLLGTVASLVLTILAGVGIAGALQSTLNQIYKNSGVWIAITYIPTGLALVVIFSGQRLFLLYNLLSIEHSWIRWLGWRRSEVLMATTKKVWIAQSLSLFSVVTASIAAFTVESYAVAPSFLSYDNYLYSTNDLALSILIYTGIPATLLIIPSRSPTRTLVGCLKWLTRLDKDWLSSPLGLFGSARWRSREHRFAFILAKFTKGYTIGLKSRLASDQYDEVDKAYRLLGESLRRHGSSAHQIPSSRALLNQACMSLTALIISTDVTVPAKITLLMLRNERSTNSSYIGRFSQVIDAIVESFQKRWAAIRVLLIVALVTLLAINEQWEKLADLIK